MKRIVFLPMLAMLASCSTMNQSMQLGAGMGAATGVAAMYSGSIGQSHGPAFSTVMLGAGIGAGIGLLTSYFVHKSVEEDRASLQADQTDMQFGDLPPSPFIVPKTKQTQKGTR